MSIYMYIYMYIYIYIYIFVCIYIYIYSDQLYGVNIQIDHVVFSSCSLTVYHSRC